MNDHPHLLWKRPRCHPDLFDESVHIWRVRLDRLDGDVTRLHSMLDAHERERAAAFRFVHLRRRFIVAHAVVRQLLGLYLATDPRLLTFRYGTHRKPSLSDQYDGVPLFFNLSHAGEIALISVVRGREVGVDVEQLRPIQELEAIADRYFCGPERDALHRSQGVAQHSLFFTYWTRKEALVKATGDGLSMPLAQLDVSMISGKEPRPVLVVDGSGASRQFSLVDVVPDSSYVGALAIEGTGWRLHCWEWPELA